MGTWNGEAGAVLLGSVCDRVARWIPGTPDVAASGGTKRLVVLTGLSGSGKSEVLAALAAAGEQVLDLQALAAHRGSAFGGFGRPPQPKHRDFQASVRARLASADPSRVLWVERCPPYLGSVAVPLELLRVMAIAPQAVVIRARDERVSALVREYGEASRDEWAKALRRVEPRLGQARAARARKALGANRTASAISILLDYYDHAYKHAYGPEAVAEPRPI